MLGKDETGYKLLVLATAKYAPGVKTHTATPWK